MSTINMPGFTAEASMGCAHTYYGTQVIGERSRSSAIEAAVAKEEGLQCSDCPKPQITCKGEKNCQCCLTGCGRDKDGFVFCTHTNPSITGVSGTFSPIGGSLGRVAFR